MLRWWLLLCLCVPVCADCCKSGGNVKVTCWGFDPQDSTQYLQAAFNCDAATITVPKMASPWVTLPVFLSKGHKTIIFEPGTELLAKRGAFHGISDCLTKIEASHLTIIGWGATFRMWKQDYVDPSKYKPSEYRHGISLYKADNIQISGLTIADTGGDGLYFEAVTDIHIKGAVTDSAYRNGLSIISVTNALLENTIFKNTNGTNPQNGVDIEPYKTTGQPLTNITFRNCSAIHNTHEGFRASLQSCVNQTLDILYEDCTVIGSGTGDRNAGFFFKDSLCKGVITVKNSVAQDLGSYGLGISRQPTAYSVVADSLLTLNCGNNEGAPSLFIDPNKGDVEGNVHFNNVTVKQHTQHSFLQVTSFEGVHMRDIAGTVDVYADNKKACVPSLPTDHSGYDVTVNCHSN